MDALLVAALKHTPNFGRMVMLCSTFVMFKPTNREPMGSGLGGSELGYFGYILSPET